MPAKPRGKGKATLDAIRQTVQAQRGDRPPTTAEFEAQMRSEAAASSSSSSRAGAAPAAASSSSELKSSAVAAVEKQRGVTIHKAGQKAGVACNAFIPPGADIHSKSSKNNFSNMFEQHFLLPMRLRSVPTPLVEAVNDFHYAMMNDLPRNEFYYQMLKEHIVPGETTVLEIGAGSGLLSMMAASLGAKWVVAVEGSTDMARLAQKNIDTNKFTDRVRVLNRMSYDLELSDLKSQPDIVVSEIFGTMLLGESALDYISDIRERGIVKSTTKILPRFGAQYCCLIECPVLEQICAVSSWRGIDLGLMNSLRDTASVVFTKKYGFRMSSVPFKRLTNPVELFRVDFEQSRIRDVSIEFSAEAKPRAAGTGHAWLYWWDAWNRAEDVARLAVDGDGAPSGVDPIRVMSTCPTANAANNFPRDIQWGQALQLVDAGQGPLPKNLVTDPAAAPIILTCRMSEDRVVMQIEIENDGVGCMEGELAEEDEEADDQDGA